jgi:hypothetical protein
MIANPQNARGPALATLTAVILLTSFGCGRKEGVSISTSLSLTSYAAANSHGNPEAEFLFPQLEIYDESGNLIYSSHEAVENARILRGLPDSIQILRPKPGAARLEEIMEQMPGFRARKGEILGQHRVSVLSVFLQDCYACSIQEKALGGADEQRLLDRGINLLVIRVSRPGS